jgi:hypothetical protein
MNLDLLERPTRETLQPHFQQLASFNEERYLHQTSIRRPDEEGFVEEVFYEDLHLALAAEWEPALANARAGRHCGEWRVHFHVPIFQQELGLLSSTQEQIRECLLAAREHSSCRHYEVETYAWTVLPPELKPTDLAAGIAEELKWFDQLRASVGA